MCPAVTYRIPFFKSGQNRIWPDIR